MTNFFTDVIQKDPRFTSTDVCRDLALLEPVTRAAVEAIIADAKAEGIIIAPFETFRSQARQRELYEDGSTELKTVGVHGFGLACDLVKLIDGKWSWEGSYAFLLPLARKHGLVSGQDWGQPEVRHSFIDADHVQRVTVADQGRLFAGEWYPEAAYDPYK